MTTYKRLTEDKRKKIAKLRKKGRSIEGIAREENISRETVRRWCSEGNKARPNYKDNPRSGRPRLLSTPERSHIKRAARDERTVADITASVNKKRDAPVSAATVRRVVTSGPHPLEWKPLKPSKQLRAANIQARVDFCKKNLQAHTHTWVFLDSKYLYIYETKGRHLHFCWQDEGKPRKRKWRSNPLVLHFYAAVAFGHKSKLYFTAPTLPLKCKDPKQKEHFCSRHFIQVMEGLLAEVNSWFTGRQRWVLIMDKAKQHTSKASKAAMASMKVPIKEGFPAQSWDINIIENVWGLMDGKLLERRAETSDGWRRCCKEAFEAVKQSSIDALVESVKARLQAILEQGGTWLKEAKQ